MRFTFKRPISRCARVGAVAVLASASLWACGDAASLTMGSHTNDAAALEGDAASGGRVSTEAGCADLVARAQSIVGDLMQILPALQNNQDVSELVNHIQEAAKGLAEDIRACQQSTGGGGIPARPVSGDVPAEEAKPDDAQGAVGQQQGAVQQQDQAPDQQAQGQDGQAQQAQGQYGQAQGQYGQAHPGQQYGDGSHQSHRHHHHPHR